MRFLSTSIFFALVNCVIFNIAFYVGADIVTTDKASSEVMAITPLVVGIIDLIITKWIFLKTKIQRRTLWYLNSWAMFILSLLPGSFIFGKFVGLIINVDSEDYGDAFYFGFFTISYSLGFVFSYIGYLFFEVTPKVDDTGEHL